MYRTVTNKRFFKKSLDLDEGYKAGSDNGGWKRYCSGKVSHIVLDVCQKKVQLGPRTIAPALAKIKKCRWKCPSL